MGANERHKVDMDTLRTTLQTKIDKVKQDKVSSTLQVNFIAVLNSNLNLQLDVNVRHKHETNSLQTADSIYGTRGTFVNPNANG